MRRRTHWGAAALLCSIFAAAILPTKVGAKQITTEKRNLGDWRLIVSIDRFSNERTCSLRSRNSRMVYVANVIGFRLGQDVDIVHAFFRVDDGEPHRWRDQLPELARLKVAIDGRDMDRPTDDIVWLPAPLLQDARQVAIQGRPGKRARKFRLNGFADLKEVAVGLGCAAEARFVR
jgi:hypothetical protein